MTGKRHSTTTAVALVCACAAAVLAAPGTAFASPAEPTPPSNGSLEKVRKEIERLYREAGTATDAYNAAEEKAEKQSEEIVRLARSIDKGQTKLDRLKARAGAAARAQYRGGGVPDEARLLLSDNPSRFLDGAGRLRQGQHATKAMLTEMSRTQADLKTYAKDASAQWRKLESNRKAKAEAKKKVKKKIAAAEKLESRLEKKERERLRKLEEEAALRQQSAWVDTGILKDAKGEATSPGKKAIAFATAQIGKPYQWAADGVPVPGATGATFTPGPDQVGKAMTVVVTASKPGYLDVPAEEEDEVGADGALLRRDARGLFDERLARQVPHLGTESLELQHDHLLAERMTLTIGRHLETLEGHLARPARWAGSRPTRDARRSPAAR